MKYLSLVPAAFLTAVFSTGASASLIGTTFDVTSPHGDCLGFTVITPGGECLIGDGGGNLIGVNVEDSSVIFDMFDFNNDGFAWGAAPEIFDVVVSGLTWVNSPQTPISSINVNPLIVTTTGAQTGGSVGATLTGPNQVTFNFNNLTITPECGQPCAQLVVDITPRPHGVPEPATVAMFGLGLAGLGFAARRRRRA